MFYMTYAQKSTSEGASEPDAPGEGEEGGGSAR